MDRLPRPGGAGLTLVVVGASGGGGASTLAAACAVQGAAAGWATALVDLAAGGAGIDVVLGAEHVPGVRWPDLAGVRGPVDGAGLLSRMPRAGPVAFLAQCRDSPGWVGPSAVRGVLTGLADAVDLLVIDVPRAWALSGRPSGTAAHLLDPGGDPSVDPGGGAGGGLGVGPDAGPGGELPVDLAVVVSGCRIVELAALAATAPRVAARVAETHVVLRGRRVSAALVADVEQALDLPVLAVVDDDPGVARDLAGGIPPGRSRGPMADAATAILSALAATGRRAAS